MRSSIFFASLLGIVAVGALMLVRNPGHSTSPVSLGTVTLVGDSLNVGLERYLPDALPGWKMVTNDRVGRSTSEGVAELEAGRPVLSNYVVVSLGTNDPPGAVTDFREDVTRFLRLVGPNRCVLWATIWRDGAPNDGFNEILRDAARESQRVKLVDWADMVERDPQVLAPDGLHGNADGYRERARAVATAAKQCAPAQSVSGG